MFYEWLQSLSSEMLLYLRENGLPAIPDRFLNEDRTKWKNDYPRIDRPIEYIVKEIIEGEIDARIKARVW